MITRYRHEKSSFQGRKESCLWYVTLRSFSNLLGMAFFALDHIFWAYLIKIHRNKPLIAIVAKASDYIYIVSGLLNISTSCIEMHYLQTEHQAHKGKLGLEQQMALNNQISEISAEILKCITDIVV